MIPAFSSNTDPFVECIKSEETTSSLVYPSIVLKDPSDASFIALQISSYVVSFASLTVKSTTETSGVGTLNAIPVNFPFNSGITLPTAFAAPVLDGMMFAAAALPPLQSFLDVPSTVFCVAVIEWTVDINPSKTPNLSFKTLAIGAKQFVVHDAFDTMFIDVS